LQMDAVICCSLLHTSVLDCSGISTLRKMDPLRNVTVTVAASVMPGPAPSAAPVWPCSDGERGTGPIRAVWCLRRLTGHRGGHWGQLVMRATQALCMVQPGAPFHFTDHSVCPLMLLCSGRWLIHHQWLCLLGAASIWLRPLQTGSHHGRYRRLCVRSTDLRARV
jgi:hypothetical protein